MTWNTGQIYIGEWKDNMQNGIGEVWIVKNGQNIFVRNVDYVNGVQMERVINECIQGGV